eukprot:7678098-Alexandrium_andersonii.AAC.1
MLLLHRRARLAPVPPPLGRPRSRRAAGSCRHGRPLATARPRRTTRRCPQRWTGWPRSKRSLTRGLGRC